MNYQAVTDRRNGAWGAWRLLSPVENDALRAPLRNEWATATVAVAVTVAITKTATENSIALGDGV